MRVWVRMVVVLAMVAGMFLVSFEGVNAGRGKPVLLRGPGWVLGVVKQPKGCRVCVTDGWGEATLFREAWRRGVVGLLAHDYRSGRLWYDLRPGDKLEVMFGDGSLARFEVTDVMGWFPGGELSEREVYRMAYEVEGRLTLQTCLPGGGFWLVFGERTTDF